MGVRLLCTLYESWLYVGVQQGGAELVAELVVGLMLLSVVMMLFTTDSVEVAVRMSRLLPWTACLPP